MTCGGIFISLGANLGDRAANIVAGLAALQQRGDIRVLACSSLHTTEPIGGPAGQPQFLNAAAELDTSLPPRRLLERMLAVETQMGRVRSQRNGPRTLDLDLLIYRDVVLSEPGLILPHPRLWEREFVLKPLAEILDIEAHRPRGTAAAAGRR
ncbi:MAG: 2-amino-4-hydroxy-6-hydroxymethyldihydropteridine diphosphokinase [Planctomycetes bacterium]|nr:2-amino-4-hydroxy-6-hydroxymethyldihydropteridine diphosphokinase [Planctomycetota bacterium]